ncbi:MAG: peptidoglycan DD-metalloendopeptidase family protein [Clostridia bacterium]
MSNVNYSRGFYIVLALCITAIGVAGYVNFSEDTGYVSNLEVVDDIVMEHTNREDATITPTAPTPEPVAEPVEKEPVVEPVVEAEPLIEPEITPEPINKTQEATVVVAPSVEITKIEEIYVRPCDGGIIQENSLDELVKNVSMNDWRTHNATDYSVTKGQNIVAIANGEVVSIETNDQYGTIMEISHSDGLVTKIYGLNSDTVAKIGDKVVAGDVIATALGSFPAEIAIGDHIHVEATKNGENIDVETLFK